jgi:hypothetical protein
MAVAYPGILFGGGVQQIQLRTEDRERGSWGSGPLLRSSGDSRNLVFRGGGLNPQTTPLGTPLVSGED